MPPRPFQPWFHASAVRPAREGGPSSRLPSEGGAGPGFVNGPSLKSLGWKAVQIFSLKSWISSELDRRFLLVWEISFSKSLVSNLKVSHRRPSD